MWHLMNLTLSPAALLALTLDAVVKGTAVLAVAAALAFLCRRRSAAVRHLIWSLALAGLLALPSLALLLPAWEGPLSAPWVEPAAPAAAATPATALAEAPDAPEVVYGPFVAAGAPQLGPREQFVSTPPAGKAPAPAVMAAEPEWRSTVLFAWLVGSVLVGLPIAGGLLSIRRLRQRAYRVEAGPLWAVLAELTAELGLRRRVQLLQSTERTMPMTWGVLRPVILLPAEASDWPLARLRLVLLHELAHVRRLDCLTQILAHVARAVYWFHPLAWLAVAQLRAEQEQACDDAVLNTGADAADYAEELLTVTAGAAAHSYATPVALAMGQVRRIERRLASILDGARNRRPLSRRLATFLGVLGLGLLLPLASMAFQPTVAPPPPTSEAAAPAVKETEGSKEAPEDVAAEAKRLAEVRADLLKHYVRPLTAKDLNQAAIKGMVQSLDDRYSEYLTPDELTALTRQTQGNLSGIGAQLRLAEGRPTVVTPLENSPALKAGLRPGDVILAIDGKSTEKMALPEAIKLILGKEGSVVKLSIRHSDNKEEELAITRAQVKLASVQGFRRGADDNWQYLLDSNNKIGYIHILQFGPSTAKEVQSAVAGLKTAGLKGLLIDIRFCPGGLLKASGDCAGLFLPEGATIVTIKGRDNDETTFKADGKSTLGDFPVLVLVNDQTASAAEILAGALKDNDRAVVLGTRSFGKGSVQSIISLGEESRDGALKLTTASYFLPSGRNISRRPGEKSWGVDPTDGYWVGLDLKQSEALLQKIQERQVLGKKEQEPKEAPALTPKVLETDYADPQLAAALKTMTARVTGGSYIKVGKSGADLANDLERRTEIQKHRETLQRDIERLNKELDEIEKKIGKEDKKE